MRDTKALAAVTRRAVDANDPKPTVLIDEAGLVSVKVLTDDLRALSLRDLLYRHWNRFDLMAA